MDHYAVKPGTFTEWEIYGFLFFHSTIIINNICTSKYGGNVCLNKHAFNHKLFHINNLCENNKGITKLSIQTCWFIDWSFYRALALWQNHTHTSLSFNLTLCFEFSLSPIFSPRVFLPLVSNLIYNLLLLFIGNLKIASTWIYRLAINGYNNYLPTNLASEINSICLHCQIVDSSLLSGWLTETELLRTRVLSSDMDLQVINISNTK